MSRSLGVLRLDLVALTGKFDAGINKAVSSLSKFRATVGRVAGAAGSVVSKMGSAFSAVRSSVLSLSGAVAAMAAVVGGAKLAGAFNAAAEEVDNLGKKSRVLGLSVEQLSALRLAAGESGVEFDTLSKMVGKAQKNIAEFARTGRGEAGQALADLGVEIYGAGGGLRDINSMLPDIARAFEGITSEGERLDMAEAIFGRAGGEQFVQWIEDSGGFMQNLADQTERASRLGVLFNESQFQRLKGYRDAVGRISQAWLGIRVRLMTEIAPALTSLANQAAEALAKVGQFGANLASVVVAAVGEEVEYGSQFVARESLRHVVESALGVLWAEVSTRLRVFVARVWAFAKGLIVSALGDFGDWITTAGEDVGGLLGEVFGTLFAKIGEASKWLGSKLSAAGSFLGDKWAQAGEEVAAFAAEMEGARATAWAVFRSAADDIEMLGERYRSLRDDADGYTDAAGRVAGAAGKVASAWDKAFAGARGAWKDLSAEANDFAGLGRDVFTTFARGVSGDLASAVAKGEASFRNFGRTVLGIFADIGQKITETILQFFIMRAITGALGSAFGSSPASAPVPGDPNFIGPIQPQALAADGGVFGGVGGASGVLGGPSAFTFGRKIGVAGEAGKEAAFAPLRNIGGELGVKSIPGDVTVQVIDQRASGERPTVQSQTGSDGRKMIRILIRDEISKAIGEGSLDKPLAANFGLRRAGTRR